MLQDTGVLFRHKVKFLNERHYIKEEKNTMEKKIIKGGCLYYDTPVGVMCLESTFPKPRGHIRNPKTYNFPVVCSVVKGVDIPKLLFAPTPELIQPFIETAQQLEKDGVQAITGSCGFLARYQSMLAASVSIPVFMSSLCQLPLVRMFHKASACIGVLTASEKALTDDHFRDTGLKMSDVMVKGMEGYPEFWETIIEGKRNDFDMEKIESEVCQAAKDMTQSAHLDALVLECTDLSAFAKPIQEILKIPVYDINSLVEYVASCVCRKSY